MQHTSIEYYVIQSKHNKIKLSSIVLYNTIQTQYNILQYSTMQCRPNTTQYNILQYIIIQYRPNTIKYNILQYITIQYSPNNTIQHTAIQYNTVQTQYKRFNWKVIICFDALETADSILYMISCVFSILHQLA